MTLLLLLLAAQVTPELTQHVNAGLKAKNAGDLATAVVEFQRVAELAPQLAAAHVNLGAVYYDSKDYAKAIPPLRRAIELNQSLPGAHAMLGASLLAQGFPALAVPHLEQGQADDLLGVALLEAGRERDAIDRLESSLLKRPNDADLLYYLSRAHAQLAKQLVDRLAGQDSPRTQQLTGEAHAAAGQREAASQSFRAALTRRPDLRGVHFALGELALGSGDFASAEREFRAEAQLTPGSAAAAYKLGFVLMNRGEAQAALPELERAERLQPGMPETLLELGRAHAALGAGPAAEKAFRQVLEQERTSALAESAHFQLAQILRKSGRIAEADRETAAFRELRSKRKN